MILNIRILLNYLVVSNILAIIWIIRRPHIIENKNLHVVRRYFLSITIGPFVVIPFSFSIIYGKLLEKYGNILAEHGRRIAMKMENDKKLGKPYNYEKNETIKCKYKKMQEKYSEAGNKYVYFQKNYMIVLARWLAKNYI